VNTTVKRDGYVSDFLSPTDTAGLSGAPLTRRSLEVLMRLRARVGSQVVLVAVGGVQTPADALDRILAGATLVQAHTGFIYGGPLWPWRVNRTLARAVRQRGAASVQELIGADGPQQAVADENSNGIHVNGPVIVSRGARNLV
jgi:dihydroorotate dehydrogenase